jgi:hypothetical protein
VIGAAVLKGARGGARALSRLEAASGSAGAPGGAPAAPGNSTSVTLASAGGGR